MSVPPPFASTVRRKSVPTSVVASNSWLPSGRRDRMVTAPAVEFRPKSVPCGPRSTSICSTSKSCEELPNPVSGAPSTKNGTVELSGASTVDSAPTPRMIGIALRGSSPKLGSTKLGVRSERSTVSRIRSRSMSSSVVTVTETGVSSSLSSMRRAFTLISSKTMGWSSPARASWARVRSPEKTMVEAAANTRTKCCGRGVRAA